MSDVQTFDREAKALLEILVGWVHLEKIVSQGTLPDILGIYR